MPSRTSTISLVAMFVVSASVVHAQTPREAGHLHESLARASSALFDAFNTCDLERFSALIADDVEFFHDQAGLMEKKAVIESVRKNICGKVRRELVSSTLEVYAIPNYGAVEIGTHRFHEIAQGRPDKLVGVAKFLHVWRATGDGWRVSRIVSYDHKPAQAQ